MQATACHIAVACLLPTLQPLSLLLLLLQTIHCTVNSPWLKHQPAAVPYDLTLEKVLLADRRSCTQQAMARHHLGDPIPLHSERLQALHTHGGVCCELHRLTCHIAVEHLLCCTWQLQDQAVMAVHLDAHRGAWAHNEQGDLWSQKATVHCFLEVLEHDLISHVCHCWHACAHMKARSTPCVLPYVSSTVWCCSEGVRTFFSCQQRWPYPHHHLESSVGVVQSSGATAAYLAVAASCCQAHLDVRVVVMQGRRCRACCCLPDVIVPAASVILHVHLVGCASAALQQLGHRPMQGSAAV